MYRSFCFFFFKQKTAYEMRISDWSSDVCSSDLQTLFLLACAIEPSPKHTPAITRAAGELYGQAVSKGVFATDREQVAAIAGRLYPLHPAAVATLSAAMHRFGQTERPYFGSLQSLEPAALQRFPNAPTYAEQK